MVVGGGRFCIWLLTFTSLAGETVSELMSFFFFFFFGHMLKLEVREASLIPACTDINKKKIVCYLTRLN